MQFWVVQMLGFHFTRKNLIIEELRLTVKYSSQDSNTTAWSVSVEMSLFPHLKLLKCFLWYLILAENVFWIQEPDRQHSWLVWIVLVAKWWCIANKNCERWKTAPKWLIIFAYWQPWMIASSKRINLSTLSIHSTCLLYFVTILWSIHLWSFYYQPRICWGRS